MQYKIVSVDMFQTLVDVGTRRHVIMRAILGDGYEPSVAESLWAESDALVYGYFHRMDAERLPFRTVQDVFTDCYAELFRRHGISMDPARAAGILVREQALADAYPDADAFITRAGRDATVCLVSDADPAMVRFHRDRFRFDAVFISGEYRCYKSAPDGTLFRALLDRYRVRPEEVVHLGDGYSDVAGAHALGMTTIWINRTGRPWGHELAPDYTVSSLSEATRLLEL